MVLNLFYAHESNNIKWPKIAKGHNSNKISIIKIGSKFNQVISSSVPISIPYIKALAPLLFEIPC